MTVVMTRPYSNAVVQSEICAGMSSIAFLVQSSVTGFSLAMRAATASASSIRRFAGTARLTRPQRAAVRPSTALPVRINHDACLRSMRSCVLGPATVG
jgi:hypothetical protein